MDWMIARVVDPVKLTPEIYDLYLDEQITWGENSRRLSTCAVRAFYRWWRGEQHPILQTHLGKAHPAPGRSLTPAQTVKLLSSIDPAAPAGARDLAMVSLMLDTGLRESEIARLLLQRVDLANRRLSVLVKGGMWGRAVYSVVTQTYLHDWLTARGSLPYSTLPPEFFVSLKTGKGLTPDGIGKIFERLSRRAGFQVSPHDLRRTFATLATRAGAPTRVLMAAGRWHDLATLEVYTREITPDDMQPWFPLEFLANGSHSF